MSGVLESGLFTCSNGWSSTSIELPISIDWPVPDSDYIDDNWKLRAWDFKFGSLLWARNVHDIWKGKVDMIMEFDPDGASLASYSKEKMPAP